MQRRTLSSARQGRATPPLRAGRAPCRPLEIRVDGHPTRIERVRGEVLVGRGTDCDVRIPNEVTAVSQHHATITETPDGAVVRDLGSRNGTLLNGGALPGEAPLGNGDVIMLAGVVEVTFRDDPARDADRAGADLLGPARAAADLLRSDAPGLAARLGEMAETLEIREEADRWAQSHLRRLRWARTEHERLRVVVDAAHQLTRAGVWALVWDGALDTPSASCRRLVHAGRARALPPNLLSEPIVGRAMAARRAVWSSSRRQGAGRAASTLSEVGCIPLGRNAALHLSAHDPERSIDDNARACLERLCALAGAHMEPSPPPGDPTDVPGMSHGIIGVSAVVQGLRRDIEGAAMSPDDWPILLLGERGTGKSLVAWAIHQLSARTRPFVHFDCPTQLRGGTAESALFGHERGAFTGADAQRIGFVEEARDGTIFLDEIGDLDPEMQTKLLRLTQDRCFCRVGSTRTLPFDGRIVAATNRAIDDPNDPEFRRDLYDRLASFVIEVPPLRRRREDIPLLARHFLDAARTGFREPAPVPHRFSQDALSVLSGRDHPGNVRELQNTVRQSILFAMREGASVIEPRHLPRGNEPGPQVPQKTSPTTAGGASAPTIASLRDAIVAHAPGLLAGVTEGDRTTPYKESVHELERHIVTWALDQSGQNLTRAASLLGITPQTLLRIRKRIGLAA